MGIIKDKKIYHFFLKLKVLIPLIGIIASSVFLILSFKFQWVGGKFISIVIIAVAFFWIITSIWGEHRIKYIFIIPTTLILIAITIIPFVYLLNLSVHNVTALNFNKDWTFIGFENYLDIFKDSEVLAHFILTLEFLIFAVGSEFIIGMAFALLLNRELKGKRIISALFLLPMMSTPIVVGMAWKYIFDMNNPQR
jgi:ABC-type sulfate transport system permease component